MKYKKSSWKLHLVLVALGTILLNACGTTDYNSNPPIPKGGQCTAEELATLNPDQFPCMHDWLDRLGKAQDQSEVKP